MEYCMNLGMWKSVFVVPSEIADRHLKLAGAAQLKVLLWILRHAGENFTTEDIAQALNMHSADVRDCIQYWVQTEVIAVDNGEICPAPVRQEQPADVPSPAQTQDVPKMQQEEKLSAKKPVVTRPPKPERSYVAQRVSSDETVSYLMRSAEEIFGRMLSYNDQGVLILLHDHYGLPIEVIVMMMQYAAEIGKTNMSYLERMGIDWAQKEILTLELADRQIKHLTEGKNAAVIVQRVFGQDMHSPTEQEMEFADKWLNQWKFTTEMLREAYERCVNQKGKYIPKYVNNILERWHYAGIATLEQAEAEKQANQSKKKQKEKTYRATYDIAEYESTSVIFDEE